MSYSIGFDIGGTKCAVILGKSAGEGTAPELLEKRVFATRECGGRPLECVDRLCDLAAGFICEKGRADFCGVGISCGGPLDSVRGVIQSPPNLPGWDDVPVTAIVAKRLGLPAFLENDANACALAEWRYGAGKGTRNMVFLTFGTGLGAGIIADGRILGGTNGMAGECGHIRLASHGPIGYRKAGSFEGFCSGGGIGQAGMMRAQQALAAGTPVIWGKTEEEISQVNARILAEYARKGDPDALAIYQECGRRLGQGLAILVDVLNPERIVIGSVFARAEDLLRPAMEEVLAAEALDISLGVCRVVPAALGERIGDYAALVVADMGAAR